MIRETNEPQDRLVRQKQTVVPVSIQNPHASMPLIVPVLLVGNTPDEVIHAHVRENAACEGIEWVYRRNAHDRVAVIVGGGPSIDGCIPQIREHISNRHDIFALNKAATWLIRNDCSVRCQIMLDAAPVMAEFVEPRAREHLFASQCHPTAFQQIMWARMFHLNSPGIEDLFPPERVARGGYMLVGGGASVGNTALPLLYGLGYRKFHLYGYDSSHRDGKSHAYRQPKNDLIPSFPYKFGGVEYQCAPCMKGQAESLMVTTAQMLKEGCEVHVHGDGLFPAMFRARAEMPETERDRYTLLWQIESYRRESPGEEVVPLFLEQCRPEGLILDLGCGTGRAALRMKEAGHNVMCVDFADNCRDEEALTLPFIPADLTEPLSCRGEWGFCADVMEHIPTEDVSTVIGNIMAACPKVFFQICTVPDNFGKVLGRDLHLTVRPHDWWLLKLSQFGRVVWSEARGPDSLFHIERIVT